jgi:hypothetical protein
MKQDKTKPYQVCFLSTDDIVSKDKDIMKMGTLYLVYLLLLGTCAPEFLNKESWIKKKSSKVSNVIVD